MKKLLFLVLDGLGDRPVFEGRTPLEAANTPNMDELAKEGMTGRMYIVGKNIAPESDVALFCLFGYDPFKYYTGRGPIEAYGVGIETRFGELALRGNLASVDKNWNVLDVRVKLSDEEGKEFVRALEDMEISGAKFVIKHTRGYRFVVKFKAKRNLSAKITNVHPGYMRLGIDIPIAAPLRNMKVKEAVPLANSKGAVLAARIVNEFVRKSYEVLSGHKLNKRRKVKVNIALLRDAGNKLPDLPKLSERYGRVWAAVTDRPVEVGFFRLIGADIIEPPADFKSMADKINESLDYYDGVYAYIKEPDSFSHQGDCEGKKEVLERIDEELVGNLRRDVLIVITGDHSTPCQERVHTDDPVPILIYGAGKDEVQKFGESHVGKLGVFNAVELMDRLEEMSHARSHHTRRK